MDRVITRLLIYEKALTRYDTTVESDLLKWPYIFPFFNSSFLGTRSRVQTLS